LVIVETKVNISTPKHGATDEVRLTQG
jgi:hypothetical protein